MESLLEQEPQVRKIIFHNAAPVMSAEVQQMFFDALNKRRPFCVKDTVPQTFILDMHRDCR